MYIFTHDFQRSGYNRLLLHGPIVAGEKYCQWTLMGLLFLLRDIADTLLMGPFLLQKTLMLLMVSNGPGMSH